MHPRRWIENALQDARFAARMARRNPGFTLLAIVTLALGIGSTTAIFSVLKAVLLNQLPYRNPDQIVALSQIDPTAPTDPSVSSWTFHEWRTRSQAFTSISLYGDASRVLVENGESEVLRGLRVDHDFFDTLGIKMFLGRAIRADEDGWPRSNVVILSHALWVSRFGADPGIIGRALVLSTEPYRVIGVLPPTVYPLRMGNPAEKPEIFMPMGYDPREASMCRNCLAGVAVGRLKAGVSVSQARAELNGIMRRITRDYPSDFARDTWVSVDPLRDYLVGPIQTAVWVLFGAVGFVLLIACANLANLLLARATARTKEIAVRTALGASGTRLAGQLLTESLLLSLIGGGAGALIGWRGAVALAALAPKELPRLDEVRMDPAVLLFGVTIAIVAGLLFGMLPVLRASRIKAAVPGAHAGLRNALVIAEVALSFVLAVGTGLLAKSLLRLTSIDSGFDPRHVLTLSSVPIHVGRYATEQGLLGYYRQVIQKARAVPGVLSAAMISDVPLSHTEPTKMRVEGASSLTDSDAPSVDAFWASPDYFLVLKIPLKRGRFFTDHDGFDQPPVALISASLARARFPDKQPIGLRIRLGPLEDKGPWFTIVGIVGDVRNNGLDQAPDQAVYMPQAVYPDHYTRLVARVAGDPMRFAPAIRAAIREIDPSQGIFHVQPMDDYVASFLADRSFTFRLIGLFGSMALMLSAIGIYGVVSYTAGLRTREIGIRMALGAERIAVLKLILGDVFALIAGGLTLGFVGTLGLARFLSHLLFEVRPLDIATSASVALILVSVALLAAYFPARRAASIDPTQALRSE